MIFLFEKERYVFLEEMNLMDEIEPEIVSPENNNKMIYIFAAIIVVILLIFVIWYLVSSRGTEKIQNPKDPEIKDKKTEPERTESSEKPERTEKPEKTEPVAKTNKIEEDEKSENTNIKTMAEKLTDIFQEPEEEEDKVIN